jgi:hypothetical protein
MSSQLLNISKSSVQQYVPVSHVSQFYRAHIIVFSPNLKGFKYPGVLTFVIQLLRKCLPLKHRWHNPDGIGPLYLVHLLQN